MAYWPAATADYNAELERGSMTALTVTHASGTIGLLPQPHALAI